MQKQFLDTYQQEIKQRDQIQKHDNSLRTLVLAVEKKRNTTPNKEKAEGNQTVGKKCVCMGDDVTDNSLRNDPR